MLPALRRVKAGQKVNQPPEADPESALSKLEALLSHDENRADERTAG
jgi:hypothetical protein